MKKGIIMMVLGCALFWSIAIALQIPTPSDAKTMFSTAVDYCNGHGTGKLVAQAE